MDDLTVQGSWNTRERILHINCKEMKAIYYAILASKICLSQSSILIATDNTIVLAYIQKQGGTRSSSLMMETTRLFALAGSISCRMEARHIPGKLNIFADSLSRQGRIVATEWTLHL
ncbi:uncharacterized protein LOC124135789 [Haliotis rufescens]|uniref:uncharacterized protein LOC124135789 n=1 Tax=Haliotis rufescens TaxID=6454 RepID=UPI001EAFD39B|nr:uncharacterized protein LOC124135789 [Haliotis rufescens]